MRVTSKKKRLVETRVEKCDSSAPSEISTASDATVSPHGSIAASLKPAELCELQDLLRQKRCQLELQEEMSTTAASLPGYPDIQESATDLACRCHRRIPESLFLNICWIDHI